MVNGRRRIEFEYLFIMSIAQKICTIKAALKEKVIWDDKVARSYCTFTSCYNDISCSRSYLDKVLQNTKLFNCCLLDV